MEKEAVRDAFGSAETFACDSGAAMTDASNVAKKKEFLMNFPFLSPA